MVWHSVLILLFKRIFRLSWRCWGTKGWSHFSAPLQYISSVQPRASKVSKTENTTIWYGWSDSLRNNEYSVSHLITMLYKPAWLFKKNENGQLNENLFNESVAQVHKTSLNDSFMNQTSPLISWTYYFVLHRRKTVIQVLNDMMWVKTVELLFLGELFL